MVHSSLVAQFFIWLLVSWWDCYHHNSSAWAITLNFLDLVIHPGLVSFGVELGILWWHYFTDIFGVPVLVLFFGNVPYRLCDQRCILHVQLCLEEALLGSQLADTDLSDIWTQFFLSIRWTMHPKDLCTVKLSYGKFVCDPHIFRSAYRCEIFKTCTWWHSKFMSAMAVLQYN